MKSIPNLKKIAVEMQYSNLSLFVHLLPPQELGQRTVRPASCSLCGIVPVGCAIVVQVMQALEEKYRLA